MAKELHWSGIASVRHRAARPVDGFAELSLESDEGLLRSWGGRFYAPAEPLPPEGSAIELVFPTGIIGRAVMGAGEGEAALIGGVIPWPQWRDLVELPGDEGVAVFERDGYIEVRAGGAITPTNWVPVDAFGLARGQRLLLDYRPVRQILVPLTAFLRAAEALDALGLKVAVVATSPVAFGISRQTILTAALDEERSFQVFRDYDEARAWLLDSA